jgi:hypothetical protein
MEKSWIPGIVVKNLSSTSIVGSPLGERILEKGIPVKALIRAVTPAIDKTVIPIPEESEIISMEEEILPEEPAPTRRKETTPSRIKGRLTMASYMYASDHPESDRQRMRYTLSLNANQIANSRFSMESYMSFRHTWDHWQEVKDDFFRAFKIYNLAVQYEAPSGTRVWLGRKINPNTSNIGAIDGLQADHSWKNFTLGAFAGSRPDHTNYNFNSNFLQFGAYAGHRIDVINGMMMTSLAFAEQRNHAMTDRRFGYFQHINSAIRHLHVFTSFEFDLYTVEEGQPKSTFNISSVYFSVRYKASKRLSLFGSYDARKNIIYYETYKNFIDQLLEDETRQGLRFNFHYRPLNKISIGSSAGYRFQKGQPEPSTNLHSYITISSIPGIRASATVSTVWIRSPYLEGFIYGARVGRDLVKGKIFSELELRNVSYRYAYTEDPLRQTIAGARFSWRLTKKLSLTLNYEGEIQMHKINNRLYSYITQRF